MSSPIDTMFTDEHRRPPKSSMAAVSSSNSPKSCTHCGRHRRVAPTCQSSKSSNSSFRRVKNSESIMDGFTAKVLLFVSVVLRFSPHRITCSVGFLMF
ncbi:hypothetical protein L1887_22707 [Cichorium endivia]|nr:hypothetical protein L1887_22707 [Cichorium endivia]